VRSLTFLPLACVVAGFTSCATTTIDGHPVFGRVEDVSQADIRAALAAEQRESMWADKTIYHIKVISRDEMLLFHLPDRRNPSCDVLKRVHGKWRVVDTHVIVGW
jgi:hypothetical protein